MILRFYARSVRWFGLLVFILSSATVWADESFLSLDHAIAIALEANPNLAQIKARTEAMEAIPSQVASLPDPMINFDALNLPISEGLSLRKEDMSMLEFGVSQAFPFPGKLTLKEKSATFEAEASKEGLNEARLRLVKEVSSRWWQLFAMQQILNFIEQNRALLMKLKENAETRYKLGDGSQNDILAAQLEYAKLIQQKIKLYGMHHSEAARLNALLNRSTDSHIRLPDQIDLTLPAIELEGDKLKIAIQNRPLLAQRKHLTEAAQSNLDLAKKDYYPDFNLGAGYAFRQNTPLGETRSDFASIRLSMNLPLYADSKQAKAIDQKQSELIKERYALDEAERKIQTEIATSLQAYQSNLEQFKLFEKTILPLEKQTVDLLIGQYRLGQVDFSSVIRAQNVWLNDQMNYWQVFAEAHLALAKLTASVGGKLP